MSFINLFAYGRGSPKGRKAVVEREKTLNEIFNNLTRYCGRQISIQECLSTTSCLTADLLVYQSNFKMPKRLYELTLMMITNYYVILHTDMYTGFYAIDRDFIFRQIVKLSEETMEEIFKNGHARAGFLEKANEQSRQYLKNQLEIYYVKGPEGCLKHLAHTINSELASSGKSAGLSEETIEKLIRAVQAEKFFNSTNAVHGPTSHGSTTPSGAGG